MLDAIAPGAAVFQPEEVDVLTAACGLAMKKIKGTPDDTEVLAEVAKLVHNLGRSRLRHRKRLKDAADAASLAEEAADLIGYLREAPDLGMAGDGVQHSSRSVPIFPADLRSLPTCVLKPRLTAVAAVASPRQTKSVVRNNAAKTAALQSAATSGDRKSASAGRTARNSKPRRSR